MTMTRKYYSQRTGNPGSSRLELQDVKKMLHTLYIQLENEGYFQEDLGYVCVDRGFVPGLLGTDIQGELLISLRKNNLWPISSNIDDWTEDDVFDVIEFLHDHISKPTERSWHSWSGCGWHCSAFDREVGREEYREKINRFLHLYDDGFELSDDGLVLVLAPDTGLASLVDTPVESSDPDNITSRVESAIKKFRRHRSSLDERRDAIRDLVDVLEFLRPKLKAVLTNKDEDDLFNIANNFGIRHHNESQKVSYDGEIWYSWLFYYYLATIHAATALIERGP